MAPRTIFTKLASEEDAPVLASIMTAAFASSDAAYPRVWGSAPEGTHDMVCIKGLFSPVQKEDRKTFIAVDSTDKTIVGFATWNLPKKEKPKAESGGLPDIPGVNMELFNEKIEGLEEAYSRDVDALKDLKLSLCFVHPDYHRKGIASLLLEWGKQRADELQTKIWLSSTPQAVPAYEKNGWEIKERYEVDLGKYGGEGTYIRAWMLRVPGEPIYEMA